MAETSGLTERQRKWLDSVKASLEAETGKSFAEWVEIARACPETRPRARQAWLKEHHGLGVNRASVILQQAFPTEARWDEPDTLRAKLWTDPASDAIRAAVEAAALGLEGVTVGQRKSFTALSRDVQFAAVRPVKGGKAMLGLALDPDADPRLQPPKNESWSERLKSRVELASPADVDDVAALLRQAWERS